MSSDAFVATAGGFVGVPWRHLGRSRTGVDCIGLVLLAAREVNVDLPDPAPYAREPQGNATVGGILSHAERVANPQPGDVLLFRMGLYGGHVGIASLHPAWACLPASTPTPRAVRSSSSRWTLSCAPP